MLTGGVEPEAAGWFAGLAAVVLLEAVAGVALVLEAVVGVALVLAADVAGVEPVTSCAVCDEDVVPLGAVETADVPVLGAPAVAAFRVESAALSPPPPPPPPHAATSALVAIATKIIAHLRAVDTGPAAGSASARTTTARAGNLVELIMAIRTTNGIKRSTR